MKSIFFTLAAGLMAFTLTASGQDAPPVPGQAQGSRPPFAWGDKNKDGICDITGKPTGQGRMQAAGRGMGGRRMQAAGRRMGSGRGRMRCMCNCCGPAQAPAAAPSAAPAPQKQ